MKYLLKAILLEITEKHFKDKNGTDQAYYQAQVYQPGVGVDTIGVSKDFALSKEGSFGNANTFEVLLNNGKPRIVGIVKEK